LTHREKTVRGGTGQVLALFRRAGFENVLVNTDFSPHQRKGDYGFMNHRLLAVGQK